MPDSAPRRRRPRYRGTHPRRFEDRYKERDPERYAEEAEKIRAQGRTPAGSHVPIMVDEILAALKIGPGARGLDATLGFGGHARAILDRVGPEGFLWAIDQDALERPKSEERLRRWGFANFEAIAANFADVRAALRAPPLDFILADLGVSSMQLDDPARGFSRKREGPLDLRMNPAHGEAASSWLARASAEQIERALRENSDEPRAERLARALVAARAKSPILTTVDFVRALESAVATWPISVRKSEGQAPITRAFQAVRIEINQEFSALDRFLEALPSLLKPGGRAAIISFHSGEDRRVKKAFQAGFRAGIWSETAPDPIRAGSAEVRANPRASSAKLRWAARSPSKF